MNEKTRRGDFFLPPSVCSYCLTASLFAFFPFHPELNTGQIQEGVGEAINGIVKHFHKPEKEVRDGSLDRPQHVVLLFITNGKKKAPFCSGGPRAPQ